MSIVQQMVSNVIAYMFFFFFAPVYGKCLGFYDLKMCKMNLSFVVVERDKSSTILKPNPDFTQPLFRLFVFKEISHE